MPQTSTLQFREERPGDPALAFLFEVRGGIRGGFSEVNGLRQEVEVVEYRDPISPLEVRNAVGTIKGGRVTLRKGLVRTQGLLQWFQDVMTCSRQAATDQFGQAKEPVGPLEFVVRRRDALRRFDTGLTQTIDRRITQDENVLDSARRLHVFRDVEVIAYDCRQASSGGGVGGIHSVRHILLKDCFPASYEISDLSGLATEVSVESLTLAFNRMELDIGTAPQGASGPGEIETMDNGRTGDGPAYGSTEGPVLSGPF